MARSIGHVFTDPAQKSADGTQQPGEKSSQRRKPGGWLGRRRFGEHRELHVTVGPQRAVRGVQTLGGVGRCVRWSCRQVLLPPVPED
jgi:hypothetical protein